MLSALPMVPVALRVHLAHATVEAIAADVGVDVLHIKGPAFDPLLRPQGHTSVDADVLVRLSHLDRFLTGLRRYGWREVLPLQGGGLIQHSTNWFHDMLGQLDVHARFPGIQIAPEDAFDLLWQGRQSLEIAHRACAVPSLAGQRIMLLLHAARSGARGAEDSQVAWTQASPSAKAEVLTLVRDLGAEVAFSVTTGDLKEFRDRPEYELWRMYLDGKTTVDWLSASVKAAPDGFRWVRSTYLKNALTQVLRTPQRQKAQLGRTPRLGEVLQGYSDYLSRGAAMLWRASRWRGGHRHADDD